MSEPICPNCGHPCPKFGQYRRLCNVHLCECPCGRFVPYDANSPVRFDAQDEADLKQARAEIAAGEVTWVVPAISRLNEDTLCTATHVVRCERNLGHGVGLGHSAGGWWLDGDPQARTEITDEQVKAAIREFCRTRDATESEHQRFRRILEVAFSATDSNGATP
jgi:hypothetical protein